MKAFPSIPAVFSLLMVVLLALPAFVAVAAPSAPGDTDYEIPLSELKKVEKKKTKNSGRRGRKEKTKPSSTEREVPGDTSGSSTVSDQPASPPQEADAATTPQTPEVQRPAALEQVHSIGDNATEAIPAMVEGARISHDPNSYVVTGKLTVVKAVISSLESLRSARCQFRASESDGYAFVPLTKEEGSLYTYTATVPPLAGNARSLRYRFVAVDIQGRVTRSQEFIVSVKQSAVVPGWQRENTKEAVRVGLENPKKSLGGFSDLVIEALSPMP